MLNYILENLWLLWTIIMFACLILELSSGDFFITCFAIGALAAIVPSLAGTSFWLQVVVWAICSVLSIWLIRPRLLKVLHKGGEERESNADALMGRQGRVVETVKAGGFGRVQIDGDIWKAVTNGEADIPEGSPVVVIDRASTIITVEIVKS